MCEIASSILAGGVVALFSFGLAMLHDKPGQRLIGNNDSERL
jgi:hypothetical protein